MSRARRLKRAAKRRDEHVNPADVVASIKQAIGVADRNRRQYLRWSVDAEELVSTHPFVVIVGDPRVGATAVPVTKAGGRRVVGISYARAASQFNAEGVELIKKSKIKDGDGNLAALEVVEAPKYYSLRAEHEEEVLRKLHANLEAALELKRRAGGRQIRTAQDARNLAILAKSYKGEKLSIYIKGERFDRRRKLENAVAEIDGPQLVVKYYIYQGGIYIFTEPVTPYNA